MRSFFSFLLIVLVVGLGAAWWFQWWNISAASNNNLGQPEVRLTLDKDRVKRDVGSAEDKIRESLGLKPGHEKEKALSRGQPVHGTIRTLDAGNRSLTMTNEKNEEVTVRTDADTRIRVRDKVASFQDLKVGDRAAMTYESERSDEPAKTVIVESP